MQVILNNLFFMQLHDILYDLYTDLYTNLKIKKIEKKIKEKIFTCHKLNSQLERHDQPL